MMASFVCFHSVALPLMATASTLVQVPLSEDQSELTQVTSYFRIELASIAAASALSFF